MIVRTRMKIDPHALREKGWTDEEIEHATGIVEKAQKNKHPHMKGLEKATYWIALVIIVGAALAGTYVMEPLLIAMNITQAIIGFSMVGILFGLLAGVLIKDIEHAQRHHHMLIGAIIPVMAILTSILITKQVNEVSEIFKQMANQ